MDNEDKGAIHNALRRALVKIYVTGSFKGTGFFISDDYVLTAYHCLGNYISDSDVVLLGSSEKYGDSIPLRIHFNREKSFFSKKIDIAVLQVYYDMIPIFDYLPLGLITGDQHLGQHVVIPGYPQENYLLAMGKISGFKDKYRLFVSNAVKGEGQSGSPVYHYETRRVIGVTLAVTEPAYMIGEGLAGQFDELF